MITFEGLNDLNLNSCFTKLPTYQFRFSTQVKRTETQPPKFVHVDNDDEYSDDFDDVDDDEDGDDADDDDNVNVDDEDIYIMVKCMSVCHVFAYFIFSHFWAPLGLEISDPQLDR